MARYYEDWSRKRAHESNLEHDLVVDCEQLRDIMELVVRDRVPDGSFSDHECVVWEVLHDYWKRR